MNLEATLTPEVEDKTTEVPEPSLREQIDAAAKEVSERTRDEAGRFAAKEKDDGRDKPKDGDWRKEAREATFGKDGDKPADTAKTPAGAQEAAAMSETPDRPTLAPNAWSHAAKAAFANADPLIKAEIAKREQDIHKEFTRQDGERNFGRAIQQIAAPYAQLIQSEGGDPVKAFKGYLETTRILKTGDPQTKAMLGRQMFQQFGIDPNIAFGQGAQTATAQNQVAPEIQQLYTRNQELERRLSQFEQNQATAPLQAQIDAFAADPANVHYEAVKPVMAALLKSEQAQSLKDAYDMAVWARPDIRSSLTAQQHAADQAKRVADAKAKADAARRAGGSITGSPGLGASADPKAGNRTLREELEANLSSARI